MKKIIAILLTCVMVFPTTCFATSTNLLEESSLNTSKEIIIDEEMDLVESEDNEDVELLNNRYYYKWERVKTVKLGERKVSVAEFKNTSKLRNIMSGVFGGLGYLLNEPVPVSGLANGAYQKWKSFYNGSHSGLLTFWRGDEVHYRYDRLTGKKTPVAKRMILSSVQSGYGPNGLEYIGKVSYTLRMK